MTDSIDRRQTLSLGALALAAAATPAEARILGLELGKAEAFSFDALVKRAAALAAKPYVSPPVPSPDILEQIDYDAHGKIRFRTENAPFSYEQRPDPGKPAEIAKGRFPATFFHLGRYFRKPQRIHVIGADKMAREIIYREDYFDMPADSIAHKLPKGAGFAGFRFQEAMEPAGDAPTKGWKGKDLPWRSNDWVAFLGASYFRAIGDEFQYGLSARAIVVDAAVAGRAEEFPDFTHVWLEQPDGGRDGTVIVHALLDSPSVAGACR
ncbi:MAG: glucan biosynthesis protein, partial [Beijerinckiaceae bacterium]